MSAPAEPPTRRRLRQVPTVLQMEATECGAACLASILASHGCHRTLEEVRTACGVNRDGSSADRVIDAARGYGLDADGVAADLDALREMPLPAILFWKFDHFVVLEGWSGGAWRIMDPATGRRAVPPSEFATDFTGVALCLEPSKEFRPSGRPASAAAALLRRLGTDRPAVLAAIMAGVILAVPGLIVPALSAIFVDQVLVGGRSGWVVPLSAIAALALLVQVAVTAAQRMVLARLEQRIAVVASTDYLSRLLALPASFFAQRLPGDLAGRVASNDTVAALVATRLAPEAIELGVALAYAAGLLFLSWPLALLSFAAAAAIALILAATGRATSDAARVVEAEEAQLEGHLAAGLEMVDSIKAAGREGDFFARIAGRMARVRRARQALATRSIGLSLAAPMVEALFATAVVLSVGGWLVMRGDLTLGGLLGFVIILAGFIGPVASVAGLWDEIQHARADLSRLDDVTRHRPDPLRAEPDGDDRPIAGEIALREVTFGYGTEPLLRDFSLEVRKGGLVALVGSTGSGKSTVGRLAAGLWQPWSGQVLLDNKPLPSVSRAARAAGVAYVGQQVVLFEGSIRDNISLWDPTLPEEWIGQAVEDAQLSEVVASRGGLGATVAEGGSNFSGGEAQRIELARALARRPSILVLDEATSALDPLTEQRFQAALRRRGVTSLAVAHRLSTIRDADEILVMDRGKVVERGRHEELIGSGGAYAALVEGRQPAWETDGGEVGEEGEADEVADDGAGEERA